MAKYLACALSVTLLATSVNCAEAVPSLAVSAPVGVVSAYPTGPYPSGTLPAFTRTLSGYPAQWTSPPTTSAEIQAAIKLIDWTKVPNYTVHTADAAGDLDQSGYSADDPDCWWSYSGCTTPKYAGLPVDFWQCPTPGVWGLTYDDGPDVVDEPSLYDFLLQHNQKATLFYIGSNVIQAPAAAVRAFNDGHQICVHTWSHPPMTTISNDGIVAELYWTKKIIHEVLGVTPLCWRPPYGDVDDRVRAIANQMGLRTVIWDYDSNDWNLPPAGTLSATTVNGYFQSWVNARTSGNDTKTGHICLEHELNSATIAMAEKWLPTLQQTFDVMPVASCLNINYPYLEDFWYPTANDSTPPVVSAPVSSVAASSSAVASGVSGAANVALPSGVSASASGSASVAASATATSSTSGASTFTHILELVVFAAVINIAILI